MLRSLFTAQAPQVDGEAEALWDACQPLEVIVSEALGGDHPFPVTLRAMHTERRIYLLASWPDSTCDDLFDPYVRNLSRECYERRPVHDDQFAVKFPLSGDFAVSMATATHSYTADVWHWKAGRGNELGHADDLRHEVSQEPLPDGVRIRLYGDQVCYVARVPDPGRAPYRLCPPPLTLDADIVSSFVCQEPSGSRGDVLGRGRHDGEGWNLELSRALDTGYPDDAVLPLLGEIPFAIAVLDHEAGSDHAVSMILSLAIGGSGEL